MTTKQFQWKSLDENKIANLRVCYEKKRSHKVIKNVTLENLAYKERREIGC